MTVMADHAPVMSTIKPGVVIVKPVSGGEQKYVVFGGFADILPQTCTLAGRIGHRRGRYR
jgi:F-type H+-transporting ATPase subunit epsilon